MADYTNVVRDHLADMQQADVFLPWRNHTFGNPPFSDASQRVLIARLSPFSDVDRSLPHLFLFQEVRQALPHAYVDLAFFPGRAERAWFEGQHIPPLLGIQSRHSLKSFDLVLFSNAYLLELINLPYLLVRSDLPLFAADRGPQHPLLILGGSNAMACQAILRETREGIDAMVDGVFFGEGEGQVEQLVSLLGQEQKSKSARLAQAAAKIEGFWAAGISETVVKAVCGQPDASLLPITYPLLNSGEADTAHLQINYGCPAFCTFCFEAYDRRPYREIPLPDLLEAARRLKTVQGSREISLYSFNFNTHQDILTLLPALHRLYDRVSIQSQRVDILQHTPALLESEIAAGKRSFTVGIEGISARQRAWLHKSLSTDDIVTLLGRLLGSPVREVKLFYLLTGHEQESDLAEFRQFLRALKAQRRKGRRMRILFSFGLLIRMPFTPLRYDRLYLDEGHWRPLIGQVKSACDTNGFEFRLAFDWPTYATSQVLALGGFWLVDALVSLACEGHCFEGELDPGYWEQLRDWIADRGHWNPEFLGAKGQGYRFALDFVRSNVPSEFLYQQYQDAQAGRDIGYCLGNNTGQAHCLSCGACVDAKQRAGILQHRIHRPDPGLSLSQLRDLMARKHQLQPLYVRVCVPARFAGVRPELLSTALMQELLGHHPEWIENLLAVSESLFSLRPNDSRFPPMTGETVFALKAWDTELLATTLGVHPTPTPEAPDFRILGLAEEFVPGVYTRLRLDLSLPARYFSNPRAQLEQYLRNAYLPYSLRRISSSDERATHYSFDVPAKGQRKKILWAGTFALSEQGMEAHLEVGPGFDLYAFLDMFYARAYYHACAHITSIEW